MNVFRLNDIELALPSWLLETRVREKIAEGEYEAFEARAVMNRVRPGMPVLEIGSGLGYVTALCARAAGPENVVAIEANPQMLQPIRSTLSRNGLGGVTLVHGAVVGDTHAKPTVNFHAGKAFWGGSILMNGAQHNNMISVPALRLSALLDRYRPRLVTMDVEGAEAQLFDRPWPGFVRFVMLELHPKRYESDQVIKQIVDCMSQSGLTYDPMTSRGRILGFKRVGQPGAKA